MQNKELLCWHAAIAADRHLLQMLQFFSNYGRLQQPKCQTAKK